MSGSDPVLVVEGVSKRYGSVQALNRVSVGFSAGEVHAVLGENGAGKSTLMGVLAGFVVPDEGSVQLGGEPAPVGRPFEAKARGIAMVHQHFMLVPNFSVEENLALDELGVLGRGLDTRALARPALELAESLGWEIDGQARTGGLPVGVQQRVEILKALTGEARVVIFDEPTAVLAPDEVGDLLALLRRLADEGRAVVLIAHKLSEVLAVADRVTVLRRGDLVASAERAAVTEQMLAEWMVGELPPVRQPLGEAAGEVVLRGTGLTVLGNRGETAVRGLDLEVRAGEVVGIGGVDGNGQLELAEALAGVRALAGGRLEWPAGEGRLAYIPQDRQAAGLALGLSIEENLWVGSVEEGERVRRGFLNLGELRTWAAGLVREYQVKVGSVRDPVRSLSGGNQQKVVVARSLALAPAVVVAMNPTRGLDVKATDFVHEQLLGAARRGAGVVLISTDWDELAAVGSRVLTLSRGRFVAGVGQ